MFLFSKTSVEPQDKYLTPKFIVEEKNYLKQYEKIQRNVFSQIKHNENVRFAMISKYEVGWHDRQIPLSNFNDQIHSPTRASEF